MRTGGDDDATNPDLQAPQGTWNVVEAEIGGEAVEGPLINESTVVFDGTTVRVQGVQAGFRPAPDRCREGR